MNKIMANNISKQTGAALLIAMVVLASVAAFYMMGQFGAVSQKQTRQDNRVANLAAAKRALISHAVNYIDMSSNTGVKHDGEMGFLPCPDEAAGSPNDEGIQAGNCGQVNENAMMRFPWKSLNIAPQFDESNECIWYAVSGYYKVGSTKTAMLNQDTNGMFEIYNAAGDQIFGATPENRVVAVLIAPGEPMPGQARGLEVNATNCRGGYTASNYLEGNAAIGVDNSSLNGGVDVLDSFLHAGTNTDRLADPYNDLIITITRDEIWNAVRRRHNFEDTMKTLTQEISNCLVVYGNAGGASMPNNLPWPTALDLSATEYRLDTSYADEATPASLLGRLPEGVPNSEAQLATNVVNGAGNNGNGNTNQGGGNGNCGSPPCGQGGGQGSGGGGGNNGGGGGNNGGGGGGNTGGAPTSPPTGDAGCTDCWNDYLDEIAEADVDYTACINNGNPPGQCKNDRNDEYDEAVDDYNNCISNFTCTPGTGTVGADKGINNILNGCLSTADFTLWQHWKDHFFYAVSGNYDPDSSNDVNCTAAGAQCLSTGGVDHAAIVFFSDERQPGVTRDDPVAGDTDTKNDILNYLEGNNGANYPDVTGSGAYDKDAGNDYLYCIFDTDPLTAGACP